MKRRKKFAALCLATALLSPTVFLIACGEDEPLPPSAESPLPPTSDDEVGGETDENAPVQPEQPDAPDAALPPTQEPETPETPIVQQAEYLRCTGNSVNFRTGAGTSFAVVGNAKQGEIYAVTERVGGWYKTYYRGQEVYFSASYGAVLAIEKSTDADVEKVLGEGYKLLGVPYVYGAVRLHDGKGNLLQGFTAQKFDCSSLVQYVFYKGAQKHLQVTTRTQVKQGQYVPRADLRRGDCIYFTNETRQHLTGIERVGHVAIYLGDNYILHTASDYARIEKISATRWNFYIEARRFV